MPLCSAFAPYGMMRFSSEEPASKRIFDAAVAAEGEQYATDGPHGAHLYATSMELGAYSEALELVENQRHPNRASVLLDELEHDWGLPKMSSVSDDWRRARLAAARELGWGARRSTIVDGLRAILGDGFLSYRTFDRSVAGPYPPDWPDSMGAFKRAGTPSSVYQLRDPVYNLGSQPVFLDHVCGATDALEAGMDLTVDPARPGLGERVTIASIDVDLSVTAAFTRPHDGGAMVVTGPCPVWPSTIRHSCIIMSDEALASGPLVRAVNEFMAGHCRDVSTWDLLREDSAGQSGPFGVATGIIGQTAVVPVTVE